MTTLPPSLLLEKVEAFLRTPHHTLTEEATRVSFINPLFKALGWPVDEIDRVGEVRHEYQVRVRVGGFKAEASTELKAPDYGFYLRGRRQFFVDAKSPTVNINADPEPAFQLRRCTWSANLPRSILTNFASFRVYDCTIEPRPSDSPDVACVASYKFEDYASHWEEIAQVFSRDAVLQGSLDILRDIQPRGQKTIDEAFLELIDSWRSRLARLVWKKHPGLSANELATIVQAFIDRIVFLRIAEDREIEDYGRLRNVCAQPDAFSALWRQFEDADARYNSGLFHFAHEKNRPTSPDLLTGKLALPSDVLREMIHSLYYPSPYAFRVIPPEILGKAYENFLGKQIALTKSGPEVQPKPEVRKAGGVFYTPRYVVDYIIRKTLTPLLDGSSPGQVEKLKLLDPSCGSGSFLVAAYEHLLSWHLDWYLSRPNVERFLRGPTPALFKDARGRHVLSIHEKKRILLNNLFGIDTDQQAVEVAKLALLLKVLEGESEQARQRELFTERVLPDLDNNIRCGNTLVDFTHDALTSRATTRVIERLNPFDWNNPKTGFGAIMATGGFDAIIGNPPYRRERDFKELLDEVASSEFGRTYRCPRMDLWYYFVHRALEHLKDGGRLSFIVNSYWTSGTGAEKLIETFQTRCHVEEFFSLGKAKVFDDVVGQHMIFVAAKGAPRPVTTVRRVPQDYTGSARPYVEGITPVEEYQKKHDELFREGKIDLQPSSVDVLERVEQGQPLEELGLIRQGIAENPADINRRTNERFGDRWEVGEGVFSLSEEELRGLHLSSSERKLARPYHDLQDIGRYWASQAPSRYLLYLTRDTCPDIKEYPRIEKHLRRFKEIMDERRETQNGARAWWQLHWPREPDLWTSAKILAIQMAERPSFAFVPGECYVPFSVNVFVPHHALKLSPYYILGVLNSRLLWKWFLHRAKRRGIGLDINGNVLRRAPIRRINFDNASEVKLHERIATLAGQLSELYQSLASSTGHQQDLLMRQVQNIERQLDLAVYDLYGLTEPQRAIVDAETRGASLTP